MLELIDAKCNKIRLNKNSNYKIESMYRNHDL